MIALGYYMIFFTMFIIFRQEVNPLLILTLPLGSASVFSSRLITALFALPLSAGAFTFILRISFSQPAMQSFEDEGMTLIWRFIGGA